MSDPSASTPDSIDELLRLFWQRLGQRPAAGETTPSLQDAAQRIVAAVGPSAEAVALAAAFANEFSLALPTLADALEHPSQATLLLTPRPPTGSALIAAIAFEQGQRQEDGGELAGAEHSFRWAREQFRALGEQGAQSSAVTLLGHVVERQDRLDEAAQCYDEALAIDQAAGDHWNEGIDYALLGTVAWLRGQLDEADRLLRQALALHRRSRDRRGAVTTLLTCAQVAQQRGQPWRARLYLLRSTLAKWQLP